MSSFRAECNEVENPKALRSKIDLEIDPSPEYSGRFGRDDDTFLKSVNGSGV